MVLWNICRFVKYSVAGKVHQKSTTLKLQMSVWASLLHTTIPRINLRCPEHREKEGRKRKRPKASKPPCIARVSAREKFELPHHGNLALHHHGTTRDLGDALGLRDLRVFLHFCITSTCHCGHIHNLIETLDLRYLNNTLDLLEVGTCLGTLIVFEEHALLEIVLCCTTGTSTTPSFNCACGVNTVI